MLNKAFTFLADESGAITVDWVVLTAGAVSLGLLSAVLVSGAVRDTGTETSAIMENYEIDSGFPTAALDDETDPAPDPDPIVTTN
ncbi:pilus assembly protein [Hasllibacter sp. MH4015]|uniref:pilus assembly protein n=1 Tax=Hasllibacter sp. MH4015 TaxID=2854029 RepID=UPI001CD8194F|nr:pilus assembly protein [Hasllibacter sp. MH4015]